MHVNLVYILYMPTTRRVARRASAQTQQQAASTMSLSAQLQSDIKKQKAPKSHGYTPLSS
jgi:hypothetical protein